MARGEWYETSCSKCGGTIHYHVDWNRIPDLCKDCREEIRQERAKWHETSCKDCGVTIKYHEDWSHVPDLCKNCREERKRLREEAQAKWQNKSCADCGTTIKYHVDWARIPDICKDCRDQRRREKEERQAKWQETSCSKCGRTIKYHIDWNRIPDLCKDCVDEIKAERAKWNEKQCAHCSDLIRYHQDWSRIPDYCKECNTWLTTQCAAEGCYEEIRYRKYWMNIPEYCKPCKNGEKEIVEKRPRPDGGWDEYTGWGYVNKNGVIVFVDDGPHGKHSHTVYDVEGKLVGYREEGYQEEWNNELWKEATCKDCGGSIHYHRDQEHIPNYCKSCKERFRTEQAQKRQTVRQQEQDKYQQERQDEPGFTESAEKGFHGEIFAEQVALQDFGFQPSGYEHPLSGGEGIDRIYMKGHELVIVEAKGVSGNPVSALRETNHGKQMSEQWIQNHAQRMTESGNSANQSLGVDIINRLNTQEDLSIRRILINTDPITGKVTCFETTDPMAKSWTQIDPMDG